MHMCISIRQVHYPLQLSPIYFLNPRKAAPSQLHHWRGLRHWQASKTQLSACWVTYSTTMDWVSKPFPSMLTTVQAKTRTTQYLMWRVMTELHHSIIMSSLIVGHSEFAPDGCFGLLKRMLLNDTSLEQMVQSSAVVNESQLVGSQTQNPSFQWGIGPASLDHSFGGSRYWFDHSTPGVVHLRLHFSSMEETQCLVKDPNWKPEASDLPPPSGLSLEHQQYVPLQKD